MRGGADDRGISQKAIDFAARLWRRRGARLSAPAPKLVTGALAIALAAAVVRDGLDIRWALGADAPAESAGHRTSSAGAPESTFRSGSIQTLISAHLFGRAPAGRLTDVVARRDTTLVLTGTIATPHPSKGFAIIGASAESARVHPVGDAVMSGVLLRAVYRDHVIVDRDGQLNAVYFPRGARGGGVAFAAAAMSPHVSARRAARNVAEDDDAEREHIDEVIESESARTDAVLRQQPFYSDGQLRGIALEPGSDPTMLARLGLKAGDVLEWIDSSPVAQPDRLDWLRQRLQSGQPVELSVIRPGAGEVSVKIPAGAAAGMIEN